MIYTYINVQLNINSIYVYKNINANIYIHICLHMNKCIDPYHYISITSVYEYAYRYMVGLSTIICFYFGSDLAIHRSFFFYLIFRIN